MKLGRKHLIASIAVLAASVAWNVWVFSKPAPGRAASNAQRSAQPPLPGPSGTSDPVASVDPATIAAPPPLDLAREPSWRRNPFAHAAAGPSTGPAVLAQPVPAPAVPVVGAILFSDARKSAIIDGRVVGVGDRVQGGVVVSIARDAVVVELASGERVRLAGGGRKRSQ